MQKLIERLRQSDPQKQIAKVETVEVPVVEPDCCTVKNSLIPNAGLGLFATKDINAGVYIIEYTGKVLNFQQARLLTDRSYVKAAGIDKHIDAADPSTSSVARYINDHSDASKRNCKFKTIKGRVFVLTTRDIIKGEEFFIEYGRGHWLYCEDLDTAKAFLSLDFDSSTGAVIASAKLESGIFLCTFSSLHWKQRFGPGIGIAVRKESLSTGKANCRLQKNPLLRGTTFIQATSNFTPGQELIMEQPGPAETAGGVGFYVTGFGKFQGVPENPTTKLIGNIRPYELELRVLGSSILETSIEGVKEGIDHAHKVLEARYSRGKNLVPDTVVFVHFGVNAGARGFELETIAKNIADFGIPDERGNMPRREPISKVCGGCEIKRQTGLDLVDVRNRLRKMGHKVDVSHDAGNYICNYAYYSSLLDVPPEAWGHDDSLFVHVPSLDVADEHEQLQFACDLLRILAHEVLPSRNAHNLLSLKT